MRLVATTIVRSRDPRGDGWVYSVDWDDRRVVQRFRLPQVDASPIYRCRGITFIGDLCYIASADSIYGYTAGWELVRTITNPLFADIHEICGDGDTLWVTSTGIDAILNVDLDGNVLEEHFLGEMPAEIRDTLGIAPRTIDRTTDHRRILPSSHDRIAGPNAVSLFEGRPCVTLFLQGAIVLLNPFEVLWQNPAYRGLHSGRPVDGGLLYASGSYQQAFLEIDVSTGEVRKEMKLIPSERADGTRVRRLRETLVRTASRSSLFWESRLAQRLRRLARGLGVPELLPGWTSGIAQLPDRSGRAFAGSSPATIFLLDVRQQLIKDQLQLDESVSTKLFDVAIDPRYP